MVFADLQIKEVALNIADFCAGSEVFADSPLYLVILSFAISNTLGGFASAAFDVAEALIDISKFIIPLAFVVTGFKFLKMIDNAELVTNNGEVGRKLDNCMFSEGRRRATLKINVRQLRNFQDDDRFAILLDERTLEELKREMIDLERSLLPSQRSVCGVSERHVLYFLTGEFGLNKTSKIRLTTKAYLELEFKRGLIEGIKKTSSR